MIASISNESEVGRRSFLKVSGGLLLAFALGSGGRAEALAAGATEGAVVNTWLRIGLDESITVYIGGGEMGQGIYTGLAQGAAEELKVEWSRVRVEPVTAALSWMTAGSSGITRRLKPLRQAAAAARQMLINAAAQTWNVDPSTCTAASGAVTSTAASGSLTYGQLAQLAGSLPVPANVALTADAEFQVIGSPVSRVDIPAKTTGKAIYGLDAYVPGMVFAAIKNCPVFGGTLQNTPRVPPGATNVVPLGDAVAVVVTTNTYAAIQAARQVQASWTYPKGITTSNSSTAVVALAQKLLAIGTPVIAEQDGDAEAAIKGATTVVNATYNLPYLAHACMEVLNCTVSVTPTSCEIWAPTQAPNSVLATAAALTKLPTSAITVHPLFMGGGLGRKFEQDYIGQAIKVAIALGKPVKVTWSREEDFGRDFYRPMALCRVRAGIDASGNIVGWTNRIVSPSILAQHGYPVGPTGDSQATEGATHLTYAFASRRVEYIPHPATIPVGFWRSVGSSINAFVVESAIDELALAARIDPLAYRRKLLANDPRSLAVLNAAASLSGWDTPLPAGHARGIAIAKSFNTIVAEVAEITVTGGAIQVLKVACAVDCGYAVNPDSVIAQMQGGIIHGLSAALWGQVLFKNGASTARNFSNYRTMRMSEAPDISVQIVNTGAPISGAGEPGVPPIAPAVANAYAALTGKRVRSLPFFPGARMGE